MISTQRRKLTEPLESVTGVFGLLLLILIGAAVAFSFTSSGALPGVSGNTVCVTQPATQYADSAWQVNPSIAAARPGNSISFNGTLQACTSHATLGEQLLNAATALPLVLFWGGVLFLLWRMLTIARREGPFTLGVARRMRRLGWFVIAGTAAATTLQLLAVDELLVTMARLQNPFTNLIVLPIRDLVPVPILAGAALLTFARIIRAGAAMDDEIKATI